MALICFFTWGEIWGTHGQLWNDYQDFQTEIKWGMTSKGDYVGFFK